MVWRARVVLPTPAGPTIRQPVSLWPTRARSAGRSCTAQVQVVLTPTPAAAVVSRCPRSGDRTGAPVRSRRQGLPSGADVGSANGSLVVPLEARRFERRREEVALGVR